MENKLLLCIDCQHDFINGSLAVSGAKDIMDGLTRYVEKYGKDYKSIVFTMDFHPINHCSFIENGGKWPTHCVKYTTGAAIYDPLLQATIKLSRENPNIKISFIEKGKNYFHEEYSAFDNEINKLAFKHIISDSDIEQIDCGGICGDYCVKSTISSLIHMGFTHKINVMEEFCPSIDDGSTLHNFVKTHNLTK